jgi:hypothetical protein
VVIFATNPLPGASVDADNVPSDVESPRRADVQRDGAANLAKALAGQSGSFNFNDTLADPFQPDVLYRGFAASPLPGLRMSYRPSKHAQLYLGVQNLADSRYANSGLYANPTGIGAPGIPADAGPNDPRVDNCFMSPGAPHSVLAGINISF